MTVFIELLKQVLKQQEDANVEENGFQLDYKHHMQIPKPK